MDSLGKAFEEKFKEDWCKLEDADILRLYDQVTGYKTVSKNPSDYVCYLYPNQFYIECKTTKDKSFSISKLTQYDKLKEHSGIRGVRAGAVIWFYSCDRVIYVPVSTFEKLLADGKKSFSIAKENMYNYIEIPSIKKRVYMDSDYSVLKDLDEGW